MLRQFMRYGAVGVVNTGLDFGIYSGLTRGFEWWGEHYLIANAVTFLLVVTWSFFWNKHWAFRNKEARHLGQYAKFVFATFGGIMLAEVILFSGVEWLNLNDLLSKVIAGPIVVLWNFSAYRWFAFV
ncbi:hypothetical protein A3B32_01550 [Candidatus Uhrbacteria bacterium RIFCSPLOWO2_01_FULL_53_9]|uniref:GtrA/DPMS transmembrane domain-containing protein n=3 Tax=Candidatus Uhriibacteriota TaxID=1752732 RepID=A0A1F7V0E0_9BACT|nr:MAG: hypothetical protein A3C17_03290 [Candidatus Uhrbacteria bacterium RIFCSPHIGHO2_02_FULL_53_13]OGL83474.1 MAG: hypothetical protein A3B32_01550 [Candidatus Uhrbacteria bacterium RIFCSPLOWO2_01_FULL_53_9]OGL89736.1 MAG: hypothetical protein A3I45_03900 [Candidatus Uhrbacteria bacterium RIFCSPLOWO2_02_FULL_53_10]